MAYNQETGNNIDIVPVSFDRHTHIEEYTVGGFKRYYSGIKEVGKCVINALRKIKTEKPDIVHVCTSGSIAFIKDIILTRAAHRKGIKCVVHFHFGRVPSIIEEKGFEYRLLKRLLGIVDKVVVIDNKSFKALSDLGYKNIAYVPNPISDTFLQEVKRQESQIERRDRTAVFVGHVVPTKGVVELVESCSKVIGLSLRIIGKCTNEMKERLCSLAEIRENGKWLTVVGEIPHTAVIGEMLRADAFIFPSYTEAFPNVILEAMACGCAIVTTSVGAIPEMLEKDEKGNYGLMVAPQQVDELKDAILALMSNNVLKAEMRENAQRRVIERYSISTVWEQMTDVWKRAEMDRL
jgi:glycosyltransferase involved in cell wall biosynthesis